MIYIVIPLLVIMFFGIGIIVGGMLVSRMSNEIKAYNGPDVKWSPEEYEIIKRQTDITKDKDFADAPWTHPQA